MYQIMLGILNSNQVINTGGNVLYVGPPIWPFIITIIICSLIFITGVLYKYEKLPAIFDGISARFRKDVNLTYATRRKKPTAQEWTLRFMPEREDHDITEIIDRKQGTEEPVMEVTYKAQDGLKPIIDDKERFLVSKETTQNHFIYEYWSESDEPAQVQQSRELRKQLSRERRKTRSITKQLDDKSGDSTITLIRQRQKEWAADHPTMKSAGRGYRNEEEENKSEE